MSSVTLQPKLDTTHTPIGGATYLSLTGTADSGDAVRTSGDGKYITVTNDKAFGWRLEDPGTLSSSAAISSVVVTVRHKLDAALSQVTLSGEWNPYDLSARHTISPNFDAPNNTGVPQGGTLTSSAFVVWTSTMTVCPATGAAWTTADLFTTGAVNGGPCFSLTYNSGAGLYVIDYVSVVVTYSLPWWTRATEIVDGLRYRFSLVRNWYRQQTDSPGVGWASSSTPSGFGVFQSTDGFTGAGTVITSGLPANPRSFAEIATFATGATETLGGSPGLGVVFDNILVYPAKTYTVGTDLPPIRVFDGIADREFVRLPKTAAGVVPKAVLSMLVANGTIYLSTFDSGTSSADWAGRVFALSIADGTLTQVGDGVFLSGQLPYALAWHANNLWVGTHRQALSVKGALYRIRPELTSPTWTKDADLAANSSVSSLLSFQGQLYVGTMYASGTFAKLLVRDYTGVYTTADTGTGGSAVDGNAYLGLCEFSSNLYAAFWNNDTTAVAKIRKYDGASWSTVYSTLTKPFAALFVEGGYLYAYSVGLGVTAALVRSADGASWTDLSAYIVGSSQGVPLVGVVVQ